LTRFYSQEEQLSTDYKLSNWFFELYFYCY